MRLALLLIFAAFSTFAFEREFTEAEAAHRYYAYRTFPIDVPEDGWYEFGVSQKRPAWNIRLCLDDWQVFGTQPRQCDKNARHSVSASRLTRVRYLTKGRHLMDVLVNPTAYDYANSQITRLLNAGSLHIGYTRLKGTDPERETGFWFENRDDMVFEVGETLRLAAGSASKLPREHLFEVHHAGETRYQQRMALDSTVRYFEFPCTEEGAYEYTVSNAKGELVDGPWAFVVVDPKPLPQLRQQSGAPLPPAATHVVDSVACDEPRGGVHCLRDGANASVVITNDSGLVYRQPGLQGEKIWKNAHGAYFTKMDWFAYTLRVPRPGRPYVVRCTVPNDRSRYVTSYAIDRKTGDYNGWNLHAGCGPACDPTSYLSYFVWPNTDAIDILFLNTTGGGQLDRRAAVVKVELLECDGGHIPALPEPFGGWQSSRGFGWQGEQGDLYVNERTMPPLWEGDDWIRPEMDSHGYRSWHDLLTSWRRFGEFSAYRGDSLVSGPVMSYGMQLYQGVVSRLLFPGRDIHGKGHHAEVVDQFDRDQFKLLLIEASKYHVKFVADFMVYPPVNAGEFWAEAVGRPSETNGIFLSEDASGKHWTHWTGARVCNPAHPVYRAIAVRFCEELGKRYGKYPAFAGLRHRYWTHCVAGFEPWWRSEKLGFDDFTVAQFAKDRGIELAPVGTNQAAFAARRALITNRFATAWHEWRADQVFTLRQAMLAALRRHAPQAQLYVAGTNEWIAAAGLDAERYRQHPELGYLDGQVRTYVPREGVELNSLDGHAFEGFDIRPKQFRHKDHGTNDFATGSYPQGLCCNRGYRAHPYQLEAPAKALAKNQLKMLYAGGDWCLPPADEGLRAFVQVYRAIPDLKYTRFAAKHGVGEDAPYAAYSAPTEKGLVVWFVNATDYSLKFSAKFSAAEAINLVDGTREKIKPFVLSPFMPAVFLVPGATRLADLDVEIVESGSCQLVSSTWEGRAPSRPRTGQSPSLPENCSPSLPRIAKLRSAWRHLDSFTEPAARSGAREVWASVNVNHPMENHPGMVYGGADRSFTWQELIAPIAAAAKRGDWLAVDGQRRRLFAEHPWFFRLFGWPEEDPCGLISVPHRSTMHQIASNSHLPRIVGTTNDCAFAAIAKSTSTEGRDALRRVRGRDRARPSQNITTAAFVDYSDILSSCRQRRIVTPAMVTPSGKSIDILFQGGDGFRRVAISARFGGGYGPIKILVDDKDFWTFPASASPREHWETRITPVVLPLLSASQVKVSIVGEGERGAAVLDAFLIDEPPQPVRHFCRGDGSPLDLGERRLFAVREAKGGKVVFTVRNPTRIGFVQVFVAGLDACSLVSRGKTIFKQSDRPRPFYARGCAAVPPGETQFELLLDESQPDTQVGVAFFNSIGLEY